MKKLKLWLPVVSWAAVIFWLSSKLAPPPTGNFFFDLVLPNLAHLVEFGVLYVLLWRASQKASWSFLIATLYAFFDEWHQSFVPTRTSSLTDVLVDFLGIIMAWWTIKWWLPKAPKKLKNWAKKLAVI